MRQKRRLVLCILISLLGGACGKPQAAKEVLQFERDGHKLKNVAIVDLKKRVPLETLKVWDPNYKRFKTYRAAKLVTVLKLGFHTDDETLKGMQLTLQAADGYNVLVEGSTLVNDDVYLALADADKAGWETLSAAKGSPGPAYMIWKKPEQKDTHVYPWPWALIKFAAQHFETRYGNTIPKVAHDSAAWAGFEIFKRDCLKCHAMNIQGGAVGPELNLPKSIVEYRTEEQIKAFVKNPQRFRYSKMPAHEYLSAKDLDDLIAYFRQMSEQKVFPK